MDMNKFRYTVTKFFIDYIGRQDNLIIPTNIPSEQRYLSDSFFHARVDLMVYNMMKIAEECHHV